METEARPALVSLEADEWKANLATALHAWFADRGYSKDDRIGLRDRLDISKRDWRGLLSGEYVLRDSEAYARLFLETGLPEADPRNLPPSRRKERSGALTTSYRSWTQERWEHWLKKHQEGESPPTNKGDDVAEEADDRDPRLAALRDKLTEFCHSARISRRQIAKELGIPASKWQHVSAGRGYTDEELMARLYWRTGIPEADPRTLPPLRRIVPKTKEKTYIPRAWTDDQYQAWKNEWEETHGLSPLFTPAAQSVEDMDLEVAGAVEEILRTPVTTPFVPPASPQTVGGIVDELISAFAQQIGGQVADVIRQTTEAQVRQLADQVRNQAAQVHQEVGDAVPYAPQPRQHNKDSIAADDIGVLMVELANRFEALKRAAPKERTNFVLELNNELGSLYAAMVPFTMDEETRERSLVSERKHQ